MHEKQVQHYISVFFLYSREMQRNVTLVNEKKSVSMKYMCKITENVLLVHYLHYPVIINTKMLFDLLLLLWTH